MIKKDFLTLHDYGSGGVWAVISARDASEIETKYKLLKVITSIPDWISKNELEEIKNTFYCDIDEVPMGWFKNVVG